MSDVLSNLLIFDGPRRLLICVKCRAGVQKGGLGLGNHLNNHHPELSKDEKASLNLRWRGYVGIGTEEPAYSDAMLLGYHPALSSQPGWRCPVQSCRYCVAERRSFELKRHFSLHHPSEVVPDDALPCIVSHLWSSPKRYFVINPPTSTSSAPSDPALAKVLLGYHQVQDQITSDSTVIKPTPAQYGDLWGQRTHWPKWFAGLDIRPLTELTSLDPLHEDDFDVVAARTAVEHILTRCHRRLREDNYTDTTTPVPGGRDAPASHLCKRIVYSLGPDSDSTGLPLNPVHSNSFKDYARYWISFTLFLLRVAGWSATRRQENGLTLSAVQIEHLTLLRTQFSPSPPAITYERRLDEKISDEEISVEKSPEKKIPEKKSPDDTLMTLYGAVLEQNLNRGTHQSPLMYFLALRGFNCKTSTWKSATQHSHILSAVVYIIRIIVLHHVLSIAPVEETHTILVDYCSRYCAQAQPYVFDEVFNQRLYAMSVARDFYSQANIVWSTTSRSLAYIGQDMPLEKLQSWIQSLISDARNILCFELLYVDTDYLSRYEPAKLKDNLTWSSYGHSMLDQNPGIQPKVASIIARASEHPSCIYRDVWENPLSSLTVLRTFERSLERFLQHLAAIHLFMICRASETFSHQWYNSQNALRSWFVADGKFCTITQYSKTQSCARRPRVVPRYLPHSVGTLFVAYLAEVLPIHRLLRYHAGIDIRKAETSLIWHQDGQPWDSTHITPFLQESSLQHIGWKIGVRDLRQILIAWRRRYCDTDDFNEDDNNEQSSDASASSIGALQSGHSTHIERHHYAVTADMLQGTSPETMEMFAQSSHRMHSLLGVADHSPSTTMPPRSKRPQSFSDDHKSVTPCPRRPRLSSPVALFSEPANIAAVRLVVREELADLRQWLTPLLVSQHPQGPASALEQNPLLTPPALTTTPLDPFGTISTFPTSQLLISAPDPARVSSPQHEVLAAFRRLYGADAQFRSEEQERAVYTMMDPLAPANLIVRLPTGGGKTLLVEMSAILEPTKVTIVVVPYRSLQADIISRLRARHIDARSFVPSERASQVNVIVLVMESTTSDVYRTFLTSLHEQGLLARVFWDEAHLIVTESRDEFRPWLKAVNFHRPGVSRVFMTATLPREVRERLCGMADIQPATSTLIEHTSNVPLMTWDVVALPPCAQEDRLEREVNATIGSVLIYVSSIEVGKSLSQRFSWPFHHSGVNDGAELLEQFRHARHRVLVATTGASHGLDVQVALVVVYRSSFDLINVAQQAGRLCRTPLSTGRCLLLVSPVPNTSHSVTLDTTGPPGHAALIDLISTRTCRRAVVVAYLDDCLPTKCKPSEAPCDLCRRLVTLVSPDSDDVDQELSRAFDTTMASSPLPRLATGLQLPQIRPYAGTEFQPASAIHRLAEPKPSHSLSSSLSRLPLTPESGSNSSLEIVQLLPPSSDNLASVLAISASPSLISDSFISRSSTSTSPSPSWMRAIQKVAVSPDRVIPPFTSCTRKQVIETIMRLEAASMSCITCWLTFRSATSPHGHISCPHSVASERDMQQFYKEFKVAVKGQVSSKTASIHNPCVLPLKNVHPSAYFNYAKDCRHVGLLFFALDHARSNPLYATIFTERYGIAAYQTPIQFIAGLSKWKDSKCDGSCKCDKGGDLLVWEVFLALIVVRDNHFADHAQQV